MADKKKIIQEYMHSDMLLRVKEEILPFVVVPLHYHTHYELTWIKNGYGIRTVGDHAEPFTSGDMLLVHPYLPHVWECDEVFYQGIPDLHAHLLVIHFSEEVIRMLNRISNFPSILEILKMSQRGIRITGKTSQRIAHLMEDILLAKEEERIIIFLRILRLLSEGREDLSMLASETFPRYYDDLKFSRMRIIDDYIAQNFGRRISIDEMAGVLNMSTSSFYQYFK